MATLVDDSLSFCTIMLNRFLLHQLLPLVFCLYPLFLSTDSEPGKALPAQLQDLPKTYEEAVDYVIHGMSAEDQIYFKSFPRCDFVFFHMGWGMGIRNSLGLWGRNESLLKSCAAHVGMDQIHPDGASGVIIDGVWEKLNSDLKLTDFGNIGTEKYFTAIISTLKLAKEENRNVYLASLPEWIYKVRRIIKLPGHDSVRNERLSFEAEALALSDSEDAYLGALYMANNSSYQKKTESILNRYLSDDSTSIELPSFFYPGALDRNNLIKSAEEENFTDKIVRYKWNRLSYREFAVMCYGSLYNKTFSSFDDYSMFTDTRINNYLVRWKYEDEISEDDFNTLLNDPLKLLKVLLLTDRYFIFDEHNKGVYYTFCPASEKSIASFISLLGYSDTLFTGYPYINTLDKEGRCIDTTYQQKCYRAVWALNSVADRLTAEEIIRALGDSSINDYNKTLKTEDLADYKNLAGFLMATQYKKILDYPDKEAAFDVCYIYWKKEFITWLMQDYVTDLLFQINPERARDVFMEYFREIPDKGSFSRSAVLRSMIKFSFNTNEDFIRNWFWTIYDKRFNDHPSEVETILKYLNETSDDTRELYRSIINDNRYTP